MVLRILFSIFLLTSIAQADDLKEITTENFLNQNPSKERKEIISFLVNQFENKKGVTQATLDTLWNNKELREKYMLARFQIVNQKLFADSYYIGHYYFPVLLNYFEKLLTIYKIPDVDFIIFMREEIPTSEETAKLTMGIPAFIMFQDKNSIYEMDKLLFPDAFFIKANKNGNWGSILKKINQASIEYPWEQKIDKVFWRGITTGNFHDYTVENFDKLPRMTISIFSKLYPDLIDASFSGYSPQVPYNSKQHSLRRFCKILFGENPKFVSETEHLKYKYLLSLDGNAATGTRVSWIMNSNSVLLKQDSEKIQWYYSALKPYYNYVPVNNNLTNLLEQIEWMKENDAKLKEIAQNAHKFIQNEMLPEHIEVHIAILLNEYSKIQKDNKIIATLIPADEVITIYSAIEMLFYKFKKYIQNRIDQWY